MTQEIPLLDIDERKTVEMQPTIPSAVVVGPPPHCTTAKTCTYWRRLQYICPSCWCRSIEAQTSTQTGCLLTPRCRSKEPTHLTEVGMHASLPVFPPTEMRCVCALVCLNYRSLIPNSCFAYVLPACQAGYLKVIKYCVQNIPRNCESQLWFNWLQIQTM